MNKRLFFPFLIGFILAACNSAVKGKNGVTYKSAVQYNDYIVTRQSSLIKNVLEFSKIAQTDLDSAESKLRSYVAEADKMIEEIKGMPPYKGDSALRDAAVSSFSFYKRVFEKDYMDILEIKKKGPENITEEDMQQANAIVEKISKEEEGYDKRFHEAQQRYADKNNMKLADNKMQKEIDKINQGN
jgi:hypothetical protein